MSEKDKSYIDPELEKFLKENKEMIERLFKEEKEMIGKFLKEEKEFFRDTFSEEWAKAKDSAEERKNKAKDTAQEMFNAFTDPEVQKHFMAMGMEFMMAVSALMKAMPFPEHIKDMADKAEAARKNASDNFSKPGAGRGGAGTKTPEKVEIKSAPKKKPSSKPKTPSEKNSD
ncbi:MAG: hypothetical protein LBB30_00425 [Candidatus Methanoplasma sp.]|jgi:hypothetical protein|nr:hypothetical protein [Candidatus Methanoplasma sp.]